MQNRSERNKIKASGDAVYGTQYLRNKKKLNFKLISKVSYNENLTSIRMKVVAIRNIKFNSSEFKVPAHGLAIGSQYHILRWGFY